MIQSLARVEDKNKSAVRFLNKYGKMEGQADEMKGT